MGITALEFVIINHQPRQGMDMKLEPWYYRDHITPFSNPNLGNTFQFMEGSQAR